ncbi:MAG: hypothetical protein ACP5JH_03275 [Bacteroidota bacterium]
MKPIKILFAIVVASAILSPVSLQAQCAGSLGSNFYKSPALAALLSIQPLPVDLGGFYAGNWQRAILYTTAEIAIATPALVLLWERGGWGHMGYYYGPASPEGWEWTKAERERFYYLVAGYMIVKAISAFDAAFSVQHVLHHASLRYDEKTSSMMFAVSLQIR